VAKKNPKPNFRACNRDFEASKWESWFLKWCMTVRRPLDVEKKGTEELPEAFSCDTF
jgi:hypothetical protein